MQAKIEENTIRRKRMSFAKAASKDFTRNKMLYFLILPFIAYYIIFHYIPMYGVIISFQDFRPGQGFFVGADWVGFDHFIRFFQSHFFWRLIRNTLTISLSLLVFGFPIPIIFALLLNELRGKYFKRTVQTITYLPHFISAVVIAGMVRAFVSDTGFIHAFVSMFTGTRQSLLNIPEYFVSIFVISDIWQSFGWSSIVFLAAIMGVDGELYDAAKIDGAGRFKQVWHITIPGIMPTIILLFILRMGGILNVGFERILLLYNPGIYRTSDVIATYVFRAGLLNADWSFSTAVGLFQSIVNLIFLISANWISKRLAETSLW